MKTASGVITLVQEHRFQLREDNGRHRLFILAHDAPQEWSDLRALARAQCRISVRYSEHDRLIAWTAHDIILH